MFGHSKQFHRCNCHLFWGPKSLNIHIDLQNVTIKSVNGRILTASSINDYNTFDSPEKVKPEVFKGAKVEKGKLSVSLPPMSIVVLEVL